MAGTYRPKIFTELRNQKGTQPNSIDSGSVIRSAMNKKVEEKKILHNSKFNNASIDYKHSFVGSIINNPGDLGEKRFSDLKNRLQFNQSLLQMDNMDNTSIDHFFNNDAFDDYQAQRGAQGSFVTSRYNLNALPFENDDS